MRGKVRLERRGYIVKLRHDPRFSDDVIVRIYEKKRLPILRIPYYFPLDYSRILGTEKGFDYISIIDSAIDAYESAKHALKKLEDTQQFQWKKLEKMIRKQKRRG